ncbi:MAG TPA: LysE family translocator [Gammaproteobacteria bacterium]|nr:LysE family translocator [Gammaproteobacteria bacterium]
MPDSATLLAYAIIVAGYAALPGPSVLLTVARSISSGTRAGIATSLGIAMGDLVHTALAVLGVSAILLTSALAFSLMKYLGAAYLLYLGLKALRAPAASLELPAEARISPKQALKQGLLCEALNPKSALFFLAFLPQFVRLEAGSVTSQLTVLGLTFVVIGITVTVSYALAAGQVGVFLRRNPAAAKWQNKLAGGIYCTLGLHLVLQGR